MLHAFSTIIGGIGGVSLSALMIFLLRNLFLERLKGEISHQYQRKIELLRADLQLDRDRILKIYQEEKAEREALRLLITSSISSHQDSFTSRKADAIEYLWENVLKITESVPSSIYLMDFVDYNDKSFGPLIKNFLKEADYMEAIQPFLVIDKEVKKMRPFLDEELYSLFCSLRTICGRAVFTSINSAQESNFKKWFEDDEARQLLKELMSESDYKTLIDQPFQKLHWICQYIENRIINIISDIMLGKRLNLEHIENARRLMELANQFKPSEIHSP